MPAKGSAKQKRGDTGLGGRNPYPPRRRCGCAGRATTEDEDGMEVCVKCGHPKDVRDTSKRKRE